MQDIFSLTQRTVKGDEEDVVLQALEFWCTVAEEELDRDGVSSRGREGWEGWEGKGGTGAVGTATGARHARCHSPLHAACKPAWGAPLAASGLPG